LLPKSIFKTQQAILVWLAVAVFVSSLTACGFHLRGSLGDQKNTSVYFAVKKSEYELNQIISNYLLESGRLAADEESADQKLQIISGEWQKRIASVAEDGVAAEYTLYYRVRFNLNSEIKQLNDQLITVQQDYSFNRSQLLSVDSEESQIKRSLSKQVAYRLIQMLN